MLVRSVLPCLLVALIACAPADQSPLGESRSALDLASHRIALGSPTFGLGDAIAVCPGGRVVATSILAQKIWSSDQGFEATAGPVRAKITCVETAQQPPVWAAVIGQTAVFADGTSISDGGATQLGSRANLVVANHGTHLIFIDVDGHRTVDRLFGGLGAQAIAIAADAGVVVANLTSLSIFSGSDWSVISNQPMTGGAVLTIGNVLGDTAEEIIAARTGSVRIYGPDLAFITEVTGPSSSTSFGEALVVQPNTDGGRGALLIGEPSANRVWRYSEGILRSLDFTLEMGQGRLGASLAVAGPNTLYVGDPAYGTGGASQGAIYRLDGPLPVLGTNGAVCLDSTDCPACASTCISSVCVITDPTLCPTGQVCGATGCGFPVTILDGGVSLDGGPDRRDGGTHDAGTADAGSLDAGLVDAGLVDAGLVDAGLVDAGLVDAGSDDAGSIDAGSVDAGSTDAGEEPLDAGPESRPSQFTSTGCSTSPELLAAALFMLLRLRPTQKRQPRRSSR